MPFLFRSDSLTTTHPEFKEVMCMYLLEWDAGVSLHLRLELFYRPGD